MKNDYKIIDNTVVVYLKYKDTIHECFVDIEDLDRIQGINWVADSGNYGGKYGFYARGYVGKQDGKYKHVRMHRLIMNTPDDLLVDHKNFNTLDNRKHNLENVTSVVNNQRQQGAYSNNKSGVRGVYKDRNKWRFTVKENNKTKSMGSYDTLEEAKHASDTYYS